MRQLRKIIHFKYFRDEKLSQLPRRYNLSKRKTGALRKEQNKMNQNYQKNFYVSETKTVDFNK